MGGMFGTVAEMEYDMFPYLNGQTVDSGEVSSVKPTSSYCELKDLVRPLSPPTQNVSLGFYKYHGGTGIHFCRNHGVLASGGS